MKRLVSFVPLVIFVFVLISCGKGGGPVTVAVPEGTARIEGNVVDTQEEAIGGVQVIVKESGAYSTSNSEGKFTLDLTPGRKTLRIQKEGYSTVDLYLTLEDQQVKNLGDVTLIKSNSEKEPPTISITSPTPNEKLSGIITVKAEILDNAGGSGVAKGEIVLKGNNSSYLVGTASTQDVNAEFDSSLLENGKYELIVAGFDNDNNYSIFSIPVKIENTSKGTEGNVEIQIIYPEENAFIEKDLISLTVKGGITNKIYVKVDEETLCSRTSIPFTYCNLTKELSGIHKIGATAELISGKEIHSEIAVKADSIAPSLCWKAPTENETLTGTITLKVEAVDNAGGTGIEKVEFYYKVLEEETLIGVATESYQISWNTNSVENNSYLLIAKAIDYAGNIGTAEIPVSVSNIDTTPPTVQISHPQDGATVEGDVTIQGTCEDDNDKECEKVVVKVNGTELEVQGSLSTWEVLLHTEQLSDGSYTITAEATDKAGNKGSTQISIYVDNVDTEAPKIEITNPTGGTVEGTVTIRAEITDNKEISEIKLLADDEEIKVYENLAVDSYTISYSWDSRDVSDGTHSLKVIATDSAGNTEEEVVTIEVDNYEDDQGPYVTFESPTHNSNVSGTVEIRITVTDNDEIDEIQLKIDGEIVKSFTDVNKSSFTASYSWNTTTYTDGTHIITAWADDKAGNDNAWSITVNVRNQTPTPETPETPAPEEGELELVKSFDAAGVAVKLVGNEIWVLDSSGIKRYDNSGNLLSTISAPSGIGGSSEEQGPPVPEIYRIAGISSGYIDFAVTSTHLFWLSSNTLIRTTRYGYNPELIVNSGSGFDQINAASAICYDSFSNALFIADGSRIKKYELPSNSITANWIVNSAEDLACRNGNIYIVDNGVIRIRSSSGAVLNDFSSSGAEKIAVTSDKIIILTHEKIKLYTLSGSFTGSYKLTGKDIDAKDNYFYILESNKIEIYK